MSSTLSSAKSYTSSSGNTSVPVSSSSLPPFSFSGFSSSSAELARNAKLGKRIQGLIAGKPQYDQVVRLAGDVFFHCQEDSVGHTNMACTDVTKKVDSVDGIGVRIMPIDRDRNRAIVFRFHRADIAQQASLLAASWANTYDNGNYGTNGVGYSGGPSAGIGITGRVIGAIMGASNFGVGAKARLLKYRNRTGMKPRHVICSEMAILAFQLTLTEADQDFIKLDAKHSLPSTLFKYMLGGGSAYWSVVAYR